MKSQKMTKSSGLKVKSAVKAGHLGTFNHNVRLVRAH